jgi:hypothetical protein
VSVAGDPISPRVGRARLLAIAAGPALMATAFVLVGFIANDVPVGWLWRPLAVAIVLTVLVQALAWVALGPIRGTVAAFIILSVLAGLFVVAGAAVLALTFVGVLRPRPGLEFELTAILGTLLSGIALFALAVIGLRVGAFDWTPVPGDPIHLGTEQPGPSMYVLLLDGYPRADRLAAMGIDGSPFIASLAERGFDVADDSLSNYDLTPFSLLSLLSGEHIPEIEQVQPARLPPTTPEQQRLVTRALMDPPVFDAMERAGYRTRLLTGDIVLVTLGGADEVWNAGTATNFELDTLQRTPLAGLLEWFGFAASQHRSHIERTLEAFAEVGPEPTFTFAHVVTPHAPFVFDADGGPAASPPCYPQDCQLFHQAREGSGLSEQAFRDRMAGHLDHVNRLVLRALDEIIEGDPEAVVVVMSDHGMSGDEVVHRFQNLLAARTPAHAGLTANVRTPIGLLPTLFNAYLGAEMTVPPDRFYRTGASEWLELEEATFE